MGRNLVLRPLSHFPLPALVNLNLNPPLLLLHLLQLWLLLLFLWV